ncbi:hypothetical protein [Gottschalkia purinilytica]|nr:hypothetical protein [Gottschalkia purinilytica]
MIPIVIKEDIKSDIGVLIQTPVTPQNLGRITNNGINIITCLNKDKITDI